MTKLRSLLLNHRSTRIVALSGLYIVAWIALWHISKILNIFSGVSLWYPPAGMTFAALLGFGWRIAPLPFSASLIAGLSLWSSRNGFYYLMASVLPVLVYGIAAQALLRYVNDPWNFNRPWYVAAFLIATTGASLLTAVLGTEILVLADSLAAKNIPEAIVSWWIGDLIGLITVTPVLFFLAIPKARRFIADHGTSFFEPPHHQPENTARPSLIVLQTIASIVALALVFWLPSLTLSEPGYPFAYLLLLFPLAWVINTGSIRSTSIAILLYEVGIAATLALSGTNQAVLAYQLVMLAVAATGLFMASLAQARSADLALYRDLARISNDLLWETDSNGRLKNISGKLVKGFSLRELIGASWRNYLPNKDPDGFEHLLSAIRQRKPFQNVLLYLRLPQQNPIWTRNSGLPLFDDEGAFNGYRGATTDISELKKAETLINEYNKDLARQVAERTQALFKSHEKLLMGEKRFRALSSAAPVGISEVDIQWNCIFVNQHWYELTGLRPQEILDIHLIDIVHPEDQHWVAARWRSWSATRQDEISRLVSNTLTLEYRLQRPDDRLLWVLGNSAVLRDSANHIIGYINTITDITETKKKEEQTWRLANYDNITGLPNRNLFFDRLDQILKTTERTQGKVGLLWIDLDGFKQVNDTFGHAMGDELLRQVGERLTHRLRASDVAARIGGDEFTIILANLTDAEAAHAVANKIVSTLAQPFQLNNSMVTISASVGIAICPDHTGNVDKLVKMADSAMYVAKQRGKNAACLYEASMLDANS